MVIRKGAATLNTGSFIVAGAARRTGEQAAYPRLRILERREEGL